MYAVIFYISLPRRCFEGECFAMVQYLNMIGPLRPLHEFQAYEWVGELSDDQRYQMLEYTYGILDQTDILIVPAFNRRKKMLVADMDSTIIRQECIDELAAYAGVKEEVAKITAQAMAGELDFEQALAQRVALLKDLPLKTLERCLNNRIWCNLGAFSLIQALKYYGVKTALISGGFDFFVSRIAQQLGFDAWRANTLPHDGQKLLGTIEPPILDKHAKKRLTLELAAQWNIDPQDVIAVGDGANDLEMLGSVGVGVAYFAKPIVAQQATTAIKQSDLRALLYVQGYAMPFPN